MKETFFLFVDVVVVVVVFFLFHLVFAYLPYRAYTLKNVFLPSRPFLLTTILLPLLRVRLSPHQRCFRVFLLVAATSSAHVRC